MIIPIYMPRVVPGSMGYTQVKELRDELAMVIVSDRRNKAIIEEMARSAEEERGPGPNIMQRRYG